MRTIILISVLLLSSFAYANEKSLLNFDQLGFQIKAIEGKSELANSQPLLLMLPATNGFSPNVNVIMQPYKESLKNYKNVTEQQLKQAKLKIIQSEIRDGTYLFEYSGLLTGQQIHVYSIAKLNGNHVYLTTATDLAIQWELNKEKLLKSVNSFKFK